MNGQLAPAATTRARLLFVHAHPDDETLTTGVTMAAYAARGHDVHLLTCTLGEEGEVIPAALAHLAADRDDTLGLWRKQELRSALSVLSGLSGQSGQGITHSVLGEATERGIASRYRDSGMAGTPSADRPDAFVRADLDEASAMVAAHIRALRPDVVVTYDEQGGYAHPDHIQTHRVTMLALVSLTAEAEAGAEAGAEGEAGAGTAPVLMPLVYCILTPQSWASQDRAWLQENVASTNANCIVPQQDAPFPPSVVIDEVVTHVVEEPDLVDIQGRALARHATQVSVHDGYYALSNHITTRLSGREGFARFDPATGHLVPAVHGAPRHTGLLNTPQDRG